MSTHIAIVENESDWKPDYPAMEVVIARDYIAQEEYFKLKNAKIINFCRNYRYLSRGYYCSLLAEARGHKVIPSVKTLRDLSSKDTYNLDTENLDDVLQKSFRNKNLEFPNQNSIETYILFGKSDLSQFQELGRQFFETFRCPLMRVEFRFQDNKWQIVSIKPVTLNALPANKQEHFIEALSAYNRKRWLTPKTKVFRYDLAILHNPQEKLPPSSKQALKNFIKAGKAVGIDVDLIQKKDYPRLAEYDALFIRETTAIDHYTYRFAKKAESEGMVVIDDPTSILRCTNKVYLEELLRANRVPTPNTVILQKENVDSLEKEIPYPIVLKIPDGSFSRGIFKANNRREVFEITNKLFKESEIILAQEFLYTEFDWRIGILNRTPLYASQYFMSKKHWQIYKHEAGGTVKSGAFKTLPVEYVPSKVLKVALDATRHIGDGLYGVDIKETERGVYVIEVNDNPSIDDGIEDFSLKDEIYLIIMRDFIRRLEQKSRA